MAWPSSAGSWSVFLACVAALIGLAAGDGACEISGGYNYKRLFTTSWHVDVQGSGPCVSMGAQSCFWTLSFCGEQKEAQCGKNKACEWLNTTAAKPMGQFTTLQANGQNSFVVKFQEPAGGQLKCSDQTKTLRTNVIFTCDHDKHIPIGPGSLVTKLPFSNLDDRDPCERNVTVPYDGACGSAPATSSGGLSTGSILLILFFVALLIYFVGGVLLNRNNGAQGVEMVPHLQFWKELPSLIVEGCVFFVQLITCQSGRSDRSYDNI